MTTHELGLREAGVMAAPCPLGFLIRSAEAGDIRAIDDLRKKDGDALGYLPIAKLEHIVNRTFDRGRARFRYESLWTCEDNGEVTGYVLAGFHRNGAKIEQICVRQDARRMERAIALEHIVDSEARRRQSWRIRCRVAFDIEANFFWRAIGYEPVAEAISTWQNIRESKSKRPLIVYDKQLQPTLKLTDQP